MWPDETHLMLFTESSCVCMPSFKSVAPLFFSGRSTSSGAFFFKYRKGCGHIDMLMMSLW